MLKISRGLKPFNALDNVDHLSLLNLDLIVNFKTLWQGLVFWSDDRFILKIAMFCSKK